LAYEIAFSLLMEETHTKPSFVISKNWFVVSFTNNKKGDCQKKLAVAHAV
jgi:hypothetical protein